MTAATPPQAHPRTPALLAALAATAALTLIPSAVFAAVGTPVPLGEASTFAVLAGSGITNTGVTTISGDIGSYPTTSITGADTIVQASGADLSGSAVTTRAKTDLVTAYNDASAQSPDPLGGVELGGLTLEPGVYDTGDVIELTGNLTLDGNGDPEAVFIVQSLSTLLASEASSITFIDGATACNLYWRVPTSATIEAGSRFAGTILAEQTITFGAGATLQGRALARNGEVTMINNTITRPTCATDTAPEAPEATPTAAPTLESDTPSPGGTDTPQVPIAPVGGVDTGDGSSLVGSPRQSGLITLVAAATLGVATWCGFAVLRRHRSR